MYKFAVIGLITAPFLIFCSSAFAENNNVKSELNIMQISGFECADELKDSIAILGRGDNFPSFLVDDVSTELKRQSKTSKLVSIECVGEPEIKMGASTVVENGEEKQVLSALSISFPLQLLVENVKQNTQLNVNQKYLVENMQNPGKQKVTQNFIVNK